MSSITEKTVAAFKVAFHASKAPNYEGAVADGIEAAVAQINYERVQADRSFDINASRSGQWTARELGDLIQRYPGHYKVDFNPGEQEDVTNVATVEVLEGDTSDGAGSLWIRLGEPAR